MKFVKAAITLLAAAVIFKLFLQSKTKYNPDDVKGMNVVVTGASSGIGEQIAYQFASMGANLLVTARTEKKLEKVVKKCKQLGSSKAFYVAASLYSFHNASLVIHSALENLGNIDVLVLNHIGQTYLGGYRYNVEDVEKLMMANVLTHAHMSDLAMPSLIKKKGRISVVSTALATYGGVFTLPYSTTKSALNGFFRSLNHELIYNGTDVSVTLSHLGLIDTNVVKDYRKHLSTKPSSKEVAAKEIIRGTMTREANVYFPWEAYPLFVLNALIPDQIGALLRSLHSRPEKQYSI